MAATRKAFSTRITKASFADVQKLVLLIAVAVYAFWEKEIENLLLEWSYMSDGPRGRRGEIQLLNKSHKSYDANEQRFPWELLNQAVCTSWQKPIRGREFYSPPLLIIYALRSLFQKTT